MQIVLFSVLNWLSRSKDASKTAFKSPTRLECMMQDYPRSLDGTSKVGFTVSNLLLKLESIQECGETYTMPELISVLSIAVSRFELLHETYDIALSIKNGLNKAFEYSTVEENYTVRMCAKRR